MAADQTRPPRPRPGPAGAGTQRWTRCGRCSAASSGKRAGQQLAGKRQRQAWGAADPLPLATNPDAEAAPGQWPPERPALEHRVSLQPPPSPPLPLVQQQQQQPVRAQGQERGRHAIFAPQPQQQGKREGEGATALGGVWPPLHQTTPRPPLPHFPWQPQLLTPPPPPPPPFTRGRKLLAEQAAQLPLLP